MFSCPFAQDYLTRVNRGTPPVMTKSNGDPIPNYRTVTTVGPQGPPLMEDHIFLEDIQHMGRGRIPERLVHPRGTGVHGYFEVTDDITKYCGAKLFSEVGKRTNVFTRFSLGTSQLGTAETLPRGVRGMAVKFYTEEGNWDLTMLSEPAFMVNDALKIFSEFNSGRQNPQTNLTDPNQTWDFVSNTPEMVHFVMWQHRETSFPDGYRYMDMFAINTFRLINRHGEQIYARFEVSTDQGVQNLTPERAIQLAGENPDYSTQDLIEAIQRGDYPSFTLHIQIMTFEQVKELEFNAFDVTKLWPKKRFPLIRVGRITLNRIVQNHWDETEQSVFNPGSLIPGIRASPDKLFAGRIFMYQDTQQYRMGANHKQLPINQPTNPVANYEREGRLNFVSQGAAPHYFPNSFGGPVESERAKELDPPYKLCGELQRTNGEDFFTQPKELWREIMDDASREYMITNMASTLRMASKVVQERMLKLLGNVDEEIAERLEAAMEDDTK